MRGKMFCVNTTQLLLGLGLNSALFFCSLLVMFNTNAVSLKELLWIRLLFEVINICVSSVCTCPVMGCVFPKC